MNDGPGGPAGPDENPDEGAFSLRRVERYTMAEAARLKGVSYHTVSRAVRQGRLRVQRLGRMALISGADLDQWEPMRERAPRRYRDQAARHAGDPAPVLLDEALGERLEIARQLSAVYEVIHAASSELSLEDFCDLVARRFSSLFGLTRVAVWVRHPRDGTIRRAASFGPPLSRAPSPMPYERFGKAIHALEQGRVRISVDPRAEWLEPDVDPEAVPDSPVLMAPFHARQRTIGALYADRNGGPLALDEDQLELAQVLANQTALAIDNLVLRHEEQYRIAQHAAILDEVTDMVRACDVHGRLEISNRADQEFRTVAGIPPPRVGDDALVNPAILRRTRMDGTPMGLDELPLARALRGEHVKDDDYLVTRVDGSTVQTRVTAQPLVLNGELSGAVFIGRDVTVEGEAARREQEARLVIERMSGRVEAIEALGRDLGAAGDSGSALGLVTRCIEAHLGCLAVHGLVARPDGTMEVVAGAGTPAPEPVVSDPVAIAATIQAFARGVPVTVGADAAGRVEEAMMAAAGATSITIVPLHAMEQRLGAIYLLPEDGRPLSPDDLATLGVVARVVAQHLLLLQVRDGLARLRMSLEGESAGEEGRQVLASVERMVALDARPAPAGQG